MLFELYDINIEVAVLQFAFGAILGSIFGGLGLLSRFCLHRAVVGPSNERQSAKAVWATALICAMFCTGLLQHFGMIDVEDHRLLSNRLPIFSIVFGGIFFGIGMSLTRGCTSRLTILAATGNLRGLFVLMVFAMIAHATLKGVLAPLHTFLGSFKLNLPYAGFSELYGGSIVWSIVLIAIASTWAVRSGISGKMLMISGLIGALIPLGWFGTSVFLVDPFDPSPSQTFSFTLPWSEFLFWMIASTSITPSFGPGLICGVMIGSFSVAFWSGRLKLKGFSEPQEIVRYGLGAALMGFGGVLAGGCTVGAGLAGTSVLSFAAFLALGSIVFGALLMQILSRVKYFPISSLND